MNPVKSLSKPSYCPDYLQVTQQYGPQKIFLKKLLESGQYAIFISKSCGLES